MRRKDREIKCLDDIFSVVENCAVVHVAMVDGGKPYVVALNFGFERRGGSLILYLHSAQEGKKMDILRKNPNVVFLLVCETDPSELLLPLAVSHKPCQDFLLQQGYGAGIALEFFLIHGEQAFWQNKIGHPQARRQYL